MSSYIASTDYNSNTGFFEITSTSADGTTNTQSVNFSTLCMIFSLNSLSAQDEVFAAQFADAQEQVNTMTMINDCMQMFNGYSNQFGDDDSTVCLNGVVGIKTDGETMSGDYKSLSYVAHDGKTYTIYYEAGSDADMWLNTYQPALVDTGLVADGSGAANTGIGSDCTFYKEELDTFMENLQSAQSTVSSQNEQQMLITNDAASKRTSILQMAQSLMQAAADSRKSAAQS